ncbi:interleukin-1 receptor type 2 [Ctenodactylus gundi]
MQTVTPPVSHGNQGDQRCASASQGGRFLFNEARVGRKRGNCGRGRKSDRAPSPEGALGCRTPSCGLQQAGPRLCTSCVPWKWSGAMLIFHMLMMGASALAGQSEDSTATGNCLSFGKDFKQELRVEGEPVVLKCPEVPEAKVAANPEVSVTWRKNGSAEEIPGDEPRMQVRRGALWILPASQDDSGTYTCTYRNSLYGRPGSCIPSSVDARNGGGALSTVSELDKDASRCYEVSLELRVFENTEASVPFITYLQYVVLASDNILVCPDLTDFTRDKTDLRIQWYKGSVLLDAEMRFHSVQEAVSLAIFNVSQEDVDSYRCVLTFVHEDREYNVTRNIKLRVHGENLPLFNDEYEERQKMRTTTIPVIISPQETISASVGSRLTIPCKVSLGAGNSLTTTLWWMANSTDIESAYPGGRVTEGPTHFYSENNENFVEVSLHFNPVTREDLDMDFKCIVENERSSQTLRTTVREGGYWLLHRQHVANVHCPQRSGESFNLAPSVKSRSAFSWGIALAPLLVVVLVLGGICVHRRYKHRAHSPTPFKTSL